MIDPIHGDILGAKITSNDGEEREGSDLVKPGAKDSIGGTNVTEPFEPSFDVEGIGGFGGEKKSK